MPFNIRFFCTYVKGLFTLKWSTFSEAPKKWLDRPIDDTHVEGILAVLKTNPCAMVSGQTWLGIADVPKEKIKQVEDIKGCKIHLIGGLHLYLRHRQT